MAAKVAGEPPTAELAGDVPEMGVAAYPDSLHL